MICSVVYLCLEPFVTVFLKHIPFYSFIHRKLVEVVLDTHENAKEAKKKMQQYKASIGMITVDQVRAHTCMHVHAEYIKLIQKAKAFTYNTIIL